MGEKGASGSPWTRWPSWRWRDVFLGLHEYDQRQGAAGAAPQIPRRPRARMRGRQGPRRVDPCVATRRVRAVPRSSSPMPSDDGRVRSFRRSLTSTATDQTIDRVGASGIPYGPRRRLGSTRNLPVTGAVTTTSSCGHPRRGRRSRLLTTRSSATWTRTSTPSGRADDDREPRPRPARCIDPGPNPSISCRPDLRVAPSGPWSASRMPIAGPLPGWRQRSGRRPWPRDTHRGYDTPVTTSEVVGLLAPLGSGVVVDATFGGKGAFGIVARRGAACPSASSQRPGPRLQHGSRLPPGFGP